MKQLVVLTGSGISAESGISTFRDAGGLWENHDVMEVASIDGWYRNPELIIDFYNERRAQLAHAEPNGAHHALSDLESRWEVWIITQNVDDLHERAGSRHVLHLHGALTKARCTGNDRRVIDVGYRGMSSTECCEEGHQMRPDIVWFGEEVPAFPDAIRLTKSADAFVVIGSSLAVYPAASLVEWVRPEVPVFVLDPEPPELYGREVVSIPKRATEGVVDLLEHLMKL